MKGADVVVKEIVYGYEATHDPNYQKYVVFVFY